MLTGSFQLFSPWFNTVRRGISRRKHQREGRVTRKRADGTHRAVEPLDTVWLDQRGSEEIMLTALKHLAT